ncbi:hypothetical protein VP01_898g3 [Puccinia sorghi]|uniref:Uncharacterized protein n=1 Tax=Puccinia sorghi TaxID=27349 RepID=A0A0L6UA03_9BASI|nr:hypothetical protein VP01_898g3 [Puccinia sorghi]
MESIFKAFVRLSRLTFDFVSRNKQASVGGRGSVGRKLEGVFGFGGLSRHRRRIGRTRVVLKGAAGGKKDRRWSNLGGATGSVNWQGFGGAGIQWQQEWWRSCGGEDELWVRSCGSFGYIRGESLYIQKKNHNIQLTQQKSEKLESQASKSPKGRTFTVSFWVAQFSGVKQKSTQYTSEEDTQLPTEIVFLSTPDPLALRRPILKILTILAVLCSETKEYLIHIKGGHSCFIFPTLENFPNGQFAHCYDLVTPSRTCQGFPQLGDYLQPLHLCTFPNTDFSSWNWLNKFHPHVIMKSWIASKYFISSSSGFFSAQCFTSLISSGITPIYISYEVKEIYLFCPPKYERVVRPRMLKQGGISVRFKTRRRRNGQPHETPQRNMWVLQVSVSAAEPNNFRESTDLWSGMTDFPLPMVRSEICVLGCDGSCATWRWAVCNNIQYVMGWVFFSFFFLLYFFDLRLGISGLLINICIMYLLNYPLRFDRTWHQCCRYNKLLGRPTPRSLWSRSIVDSAVRIDERWLADHGAEGEQLFGGTGHTMCALFSCKSTNTWTSNTSLFFTQYISRFQNPQPRGRLRHRVLTPTSIECMYLFILFFSPRWCGYYPFRLSSITANVTLALCLIGIKFDGDLVLVISPVQESPGRVDRANKIYYIIIPGNSLWVYVVAIHIIHSGVLETLFRLSPCIPILYLILPSFPILLLVLVSFQCAHKLRETRLCKKHHRSTLLNISAGLGLDNNTNELVDDCLLPSTCFFPMVSLATSCVPLLSFPHRQLLMMMMTQTLDITCFACSMLPFLCSQLGYNLLCFFIARDAPVSLSWLAWSELLTFNKRETTPKVKRKKKKLKIKKQRKSIKSPSRHHLQATKHKQALKHTSPSSLCLSFLAKHLPSPLRLRHESKYDTHNLSTPMNPNCLSIPSQLGSTHSQSLTSSASLFKTFTHPPLSPQPTNPFLLAPSTHSWLSFNTLHHCAESA